MISFFIYFVFYTMMLMLFTCLINKVLIRYWSQSKRYHYIFFSIKNNVLVYLLMPFFAYLSSSYRKISVHKILKYIIGFMLILYLIGFIYMGMDMIRIYRKEQEISKICIPCEDFFATQVFEFMKKSEHMERCRIELCQNERIMIPQARGILFPKIVLPYGRFYSYINRDLEIILTHELNHHKYRDILYRHFCHLIVIIYWFEPTVYLLMKQFLFWSEIRVDFATCENKDLQLEEGEYVAFLFKLMEQHNPRIRLMKVYEELQNSSIERMQIIANRNKKKIKSIE